MQKTIKDINPKNTDPSPGYLGKLGDSKIIEKDGMLIKKKTPREYNKLWKIFKKNHAEDYCTKMGYSVKDIEQIGIEKFIDTHDWRSVDDIHKWRTDRVQVMICAHCKNEFTTYQIDLGICDNCKKHYNLVKLTEMCEANEKKEPGISGGLRTAFAFDDTFRNFFLKK